MTITDFIDIFDNIKPTLQEIKNTNGILTDDVILELWQEYDLKIVSLEIYETLLIDIIGNTNICDLYFSPFVFKKPSINREQFEFCKIIEKGSLFYNKDSNTIIFNSNVENRKGDIKQQIDQLDFVKFLLKYWELEFNRVFRGGGDLYYSKSLKIDNLRVGQFVLFEEMLKEIG